MKRKLSRIHSPWRRRAITVLIHVILLLGKFSPRARAHWVGRPYRPPRLERPFFVLVFLSAIITLEPHDIAYWAVLAGGISSLFLLLSTIYLFLPHKRHHWISKN